MKKPNLPTSTSTLMHQQQQRQSRRSTLQAVVIGAIVGLLLLAVLLLVVVSRDSGTDAAAAVPAPDVYLPVEPGVLPFPSEPNEQFNEEAVTLGRCVLAFINDHGGPLAVRPGAVYQTEQALMSDAVKSCTTKS